MLVRMDNDNYGLLSKFYCAFTLCLNPSIYCGIREK